MAVSFGVSLGAAIVKDVVYAAIRQLRYSFCFSNLVEDVVREKERLLLTRNSVLEKSEKAKKRTEKIASDVEQWLNDANLILEEVEMLEVKAKEKKSTFLCHCPIWIWRHRLGKEAARKADTIRKLDKNSEFKQFSRLATLPGMKYYSSEGFIYFESTKSTYDQILNALKDDEVCMIGVYGMGGTGKTALVKEVGKEAEQIFDKVVFLAVSSAIDVRKIQGNIASSLGFELKEEDISERAKRLSMRLTTGESILIILDDVWQMLDFEAIGIPFGKDLVGFKCNVLLTTRSRQVCSMMDCQIIVPLSLIAEEEAWALFQKHADITDSASDPLKGLAQAITNECKGLPVAIKAVASTLKGKNLVEWEEALETLRDSRPLDIEPGLENPYKCLQLSYDNLKNDDAKSLFLLCSFFPEDSEIPLEILIRFGFGLGLFEQVNSFKRARTKVSAIINKLISSGLLLQAEERPSVLMHDLVRDVALWIAKEEVHVILGPKMDTEALREDTNIKHTVRFLYCYNINEFPDQLDCPNLEILYMYTEGKGSFQVPNSLFNGVKELKVLTLHFHRLLKGTPCLLVAQAIYCLTNLRTLCLKGCKLDNISFLGNLEKLETLEFCNCMINELPNDTAELRKLRLLDVSLCSIGGNPYEVLGRCSQLEELYFVKNDLSEKVLNDQNLAKFFHKSSSSHRLQRYHVDIGSYNYKFKGDMRSRFLSINHFDVSISSSTIKDLIQRAEILFLRKIKRGCKNIAPDIVHIEGKSTNELVELHIDSSEEMECLIDTTALFELGIVFPNLVKLRMSWMKRFKALFCGPPPLGLFEKLEELRVAQCSQLCSIISFWKLNLQNLKILKFENCPMLTSLFSSAVTQSLGQLEVLKIRHCDGLKHIMTGEDAEIVLDDNGQQVFRSVFTKLKRLIVKWCGQLESLIPVSFSKGLVQLEYLEIDKAPELKYIFYQNQLSCQNQNELHIIEFPVLKLLKLLHLPNIINICPENYHPMWPSLQNLYLLQCPHLNIMSVNNSIFGLTTRHQGDIEEPMPLVTHSSQVVNGVSPLLTLQHVESLVVGFCKIEGIFQLTGLPINGVIDQLTSCLHRLSLENLPELGYIFRGPLQVLSLPNLVELCVHGCRKLKYIFSSCIAGSLPHLEVLDIKYCDQLEEIIEDEEQRNHLNHCKESNEGEITLVSTTLEDMTLIHQSTGPFNFHSLKQLKLASCPMLRSLFTPLTAKTLTSLQYLTIEECHRLKFLVAEEAGQENSPEEIVKEDHEGESHVFFSKLEVLRVEKCDALEYIFPVSYAQGLVELKNMVVSETHQIKYIFGESHHSENSSSRKKNQIQVQLPVLTEFCLRGLPSIISICPERFYVECLSLRRFSLDSLGLPIMSMKNSMKSSKEIEGGCTSNQVSLEEVPDIQTIESSGKLSLCTCEIEAVFQIEGPSINKHQDSLTLSLSYLDLHNLPELRHIWKGPQQLLNLENLMELSVFECEKLKYIFSSSVLRSLPQLMSLTIKHCELLVQIIEEDEGDRNTLDCHCQNVCFPRLEILDIQQCNNLKCLFSIFSPLELPQLQFLFIEYCSLLEKVFRGKECEIEQEQVLLLPTMECLRLRKLPNLIDICQGFKLKSVYHEVEDCPKLASAAAATLKILPQEHRYPEENREHKEERKGNKGKQKLLIEETNAVDLTKSSIKIKEVNQGDASSSTSTPSIDAGFYPDNNTTETIFDLPKVPEDYIQGLGNNCKTKHLCEDFNCGVAVSALMAPQELYTPVPAALNGHDPSPAVVPNSAPTDSSLITPSTAIQSSVSLPAVDIPPTEVASLEITPTEEYAIFRGIGAIKKRHIHHLEQAISSYPSLWSWREKFTRPKMREFGYAILGDMLEFLTVTLQYAILGDMLEFLTVTRWGDLTETKKAEFESLVCELEAFGFDIQWLKNTETLIKQSKADKEAIDHMKRLEVQVQEQHTVMQELEVRFQVAKEELTNLKSELGRIRCELGNFDDFIGF